MCAVNIGVAMVTNIISQLLSLFLLYNFNIFVTRHFAIGDHFNCTCCFENEYKKSCLLCRNFISSYRIKRTLHGSLGIRILSSSAESISHKSRVSEANEWEIFSARALFKRQRPAKMLQSWYSQTLFYGCPLNPLSPNIHIQILQTDLYIFP